jgi:hypothetical protein
MRPSPNGLRLSLAQSTPTRFDPEMPDANEIQESKPATELPQDSPRALRFKGSAGDWFLRGIFFLAFMFFATGKFKNSAGAPWVVLFKQVGVGHGFRYFTGVVEFIGAALLLFSQTVERGLAVLIAVTFGATMILILVLHRAPDALVPFAFMSAMIAFWMHRRRV